MDTLLPKDRATRYAVLGPLLGALGVAAMVGLTWREVQRYGPESLADLGYFFAALAAVPTVFALLLLGVAVLLGRESGRLMMILAAVVGVVAAAVPWGSLLVWILG